MPGWLIAVAVIVVFAAAAFWWWVPKWQANLLRMKIRDAKARADVEDNWRKTIGQLLGGAAVLIGTGLAYVQWQGTQQTAHDQIISQQVAKGFEQLGNDNPVIRLGGIYALEGVMNNSEQYHQPVLEALCAFVRLNAPSKAAENEPEKLPATDIQAALTVIGRRKPGPGRVDLNFTGLHWAKLTGAELTGADLSAANLSYARLNGANMSYSDLRATNLSDADLKHANLQHANLTPFFLISANLTGAELTGADLNNANLSIANLQHAKLSDADLRDTNLSYADLTGSDLSRAHLERADLSGANLSGANLFDADLSGADLSGANLFLTSVTQSQLAVACGDKETKLPGQQTIKPCQP